jgi:hypothetical protein
MQGRPPPRHSNVATARIVFFVQHSVVSAAPVTPMMSMSSGNGTALRYERFDTVM